MPNYLIDGDLIMTTTAPEQSEETNNIVRKALDDMLYMTTKINLSDDIIESINKLKEQFNAADAKKMIDDVSKFDVRLFFKVVDVISILVQEQSQAIQNKLFADYIAPIANEDMAEAEDTEDTEVLFPEGYEEDKEEATEEE